MIKKLTSILTVLCMVITLLPTAAFAQVSGNTPLPTAPPPQITTQNTPQGENGLEAEKPADAENADETKTNPEAEKAIPAEKDADENPQNGFAQPPAAVCTCTVKCTLADAAANTAVVINSACPLCTAQNADLNAVCAPSLTAAAPALASPRSTPVVVNDNAALQVAIEAAVSAGTSDTSIKLNSGFAVVQSQSITIPAGNACNFTIDLNSQILAIALSYTTFIHKGSGTVTFSNGTVQSAEQTAIENAGDGNIIIDGGKIIGGNGSAGSIAIKNSGSGNITIDGTEVIGNKGPSISSSGTGNININQSAGKTTSVTYAGTDEFNYNSTISVRGGTININGGTITSSVKNTIHVSVNGTLNISEGEISAEGNGFSAISVIGAGTVNVNGGKVTTSKLAIAGISLDNGSNGSTVNITDGEVICSKANGNAIYVNAAVTAGTLNISGGKVTGNDATAIHVSTTGITINISGGKVTGNNATAIHASTTGATINISGGTVSATGSANYAVFSKGSKVNISQGSNAAPTFITSEAKGVSGEYSGTVHIYDSTDNLLEISGGTIDNTAVGSYAYSVYYYGDCLITGGNIKSYAGTSNIANAEGKRLYLVTFTEPTGNTGKAFAVTSPAGYNLTKSTPLNGKWCVFLPKGEAEATYDNKKYIATVLTTHKAVFTEYVAAAKNTVTNTEYDTVQKAVDAVEEGQTIQLQKSVNDTITITKAASFTLDLNGKTLDVSASATGSVITHSGAGALTIIESGTAGTILQSNGSFPTISLASSGTLNINGGSVTSVSTNPAVKVTSSGILNIDGANISADTGQTIEHSGSGLVTIAQTSGSKKTIISGANKSSGVIYLNGSSSNETLKITGGTIKTTGNGSVAIYIAKNNKALISGGIVNAVGADKAICAVDNSTVNITGGTVSSDKGNAITNNSLGNASTAAVTVSGTAVVTSGNTTATSGTIFNDSTVTSYPTLKIDGGQVKNTAGGNAIYNYNYCNIEISNGTVSTEGSMAIDHTIYLVETLGDGQLLKITGGTVQNSGTGAVIYNKNRYGKISVSGGNITALGAGNAIHSYETAPVEISGGKVSATAGNAIHNAAAGKIYISGSAVITSGAATATNPGTIFLASNSASGNLLFLSGGTIENTASNGIAINSNNGSVAVTGGSPVIKGGRKAMSLAPDLTTYPPAPQVTASTNFDGSSPVEYVPANIAAYKYLTFVKGPAPATVTISVAPSTVYNGSPVSAVASVTNSSGTPLTSGTITYSYKGVNGTAYGPLAAAPSSAGEYQVTASYAETADYAGSKTANFTISKKPLTVSIVCTGKQWDNTDAAAVTYNISGLVTADMGNVTASGTSASYNNSDAGADKLVTAAGITLSGTASSNYSCNATATTTAEITMVPAPTTPAAPTINFSAEQLTLTANMEYKVGTADWQPCSGTSMDIADLGYNGTELAVVFRIAGDNNHRPSAQVSLTIPARPQTPVENLFTVTKPTTAGGIDGALSGVLSTMEYKAGLGDYVSGTGANIENITDGTVITIRYKAVLNTSFASNTVSITIASKTPAVITFANNTVTYNGLQQSHENAVAKTADGTILSGAFTYQYAVKNGSVLSAPPKDAGTYTVTAKYEDNAYQAYQTVDFTITAAPITVTSYTVTHKSYDGTQNAVITAVSFSGLKNAETLELNTDYIITDAKFSSVNAAQNLDVTGKVSLQGAKSANYSLANSTLTGQKANINKVSLTAGTVTAGQKKPYDATKAFTDVNVTYTGGVNSETPTGRVNGNTSDESASASKALQVTQQTLNAAFAQNYTLPDNSSVTGNVEIEKIAPAITIECSGTAMAGDEVLVKVKINNPSSASAGFPNASEVNLTFTGNADALGALTETTEKGIYSQKFIIKSTAAANDIITFSVNIPADTANYKKTTSNITQNLTVSDKLGTTTAISASNLSVTYGDSVTLTASVSKTNPSDTGTLGGTVQFTVGGNNIGAPQPLSGGTAALTVDKATLQAASGGKKHSFAAVFTASGNKFANSTSTPLEVTVNQITLTITAKDEFTYQYRTWGDVPVPQLVYTGFISGEDESVLTSNTFAAIHSVANTNLAGKHSININGTTANTNYNCVIPAEHGFLTIIAAVAEANPPAHQLPSSPIAKPEIIVQPDDPAAHLRVITATLSSTEQQKAATWLLSQPEISPNHLMTSYEVELQVSHDGGTTWTKATMADVKGGKVKVALPIPAGTSPDTHTFTIYHFANGVNSAAEKLTGEINSASSSVSATVTSLSPFVLVASPKPAGTTGGQTNNSVVKPNPQTGDTYDMQAPAAIGDIANPSANKTLSAQKTIAVIVIANCTALLALLCAALWLTKRKTKAKNKN